MALHTRYTRRRSPDTLALVIAAVLACLLCQAGWSAAFGDGLPQFAVGPRRQLLREFTPLQKVRRGAAGAAGLAAASRRAEGRRADAGVPFAFGPAIQWLQLVAAFGAPRVASGPRRRAQPTVAHRLSPARVAARAQRPYNAPLLPFLRCFVHAVP
jgi:hypothetical protein